MHGRYPELEEYWSESQGTLRSQPPHAADRWVAEFSQHGPHGDPDSWADSFGQQHGANGWASEFEQVTKTSFETPAIHENCFFSTSK